MRATAVIIILVAFCPLWASNAENTRPFTVADSIAMTRLIEPDIALEHFKALTFKFSPDGQKFIIVTRRGDLATGVNEYALVLFDVTDVLAFVNTPERATLPRQDVLVRRETPSEKHAIDEVKWLPDNQRLAFIGRGMDEIGQVHVVDLRTHEVQQLTNHPKDIAKFDLAWRAQKLVYSAPAKQDWSGRTKHGYAVKSERLEAVISANDFGEGSDLKYFVADLKGGRIVEAAVEPGLSGLPPNISISPSGRWAVVPIQVRRLPAHWGAYEFLQRHLARAEEVNPTRGESNAVSTTQFIEDDAFGRPSHWIDRYYLIDLSTGAAKSLVDAPGMSLGLDVHW